ncbi:hypothetical protein CEXT_519421 [Caerostris extrusa]|uniref:Uncharacterized protein n=1 Tax=Caerostris extrusa TaxID=172846 RepID=A0AAV4VZ81_CAEEX|nr:hypothetical protein CEXT_519421 [Caerostris extrusa]
MLPKTPSRQKRYAWDTLTILHQQNLSISSSEPRFIMANRVVSIDGPAIRWWPSKRTCCTLSGKMDGSFWVVVHLNQLYMGKLINLDALERL